MIIRRVCTRLQFRSCEARAYEAFILTVHDNVFKDDNKCRKYTLKWDLLRCASIRSKQHVDLVACCRVICVLIPHLSVQLVTNKRERKPCRTSQQSVVSRCVDYSTHSCRCINGSVQ